ncbi:MAG: amino acid adenylation domain-containing protein [Phycisphaerales bacterium]
MSGPSTTERPAPGTIAALTSGQRLMWTGQQLHPAVPLYNMAFLFTVQRRLEPDVFGRAVARLAAECDMLQVAIESDGGVPRQVIRPSAGPTVELVDLTTSPNDAAADAAALAWAEAATRECFELTRGLSRIALLPLPGERTAWWLGQHHVATDGWTVRVILDRLGELYRDEAGEAPATSEPPPSYVAAMDLASTDVADVADAAGAAGVARAAGAAVAAKSSSDAAAGTGTQPPAFYGQRPGTTSTASERISFALGADQTARIREAAMRPEVRGLTPDMGLFNVLATATLAWLRQTSDRWPALGVAMHQRTTPDARRTAGLFSEVRPLRIDAGGFADDAMPTWAELGAAVRSAATAMMLAGRPGADAPPVARDVGVVLNVIPGTLGPFAGAACSTQWIHPGHADREHAIRLQVHDFDGTGSLQIGIECNTEVFGDAAARERAAEHFRRTLDHLVDAWDAPVDAQPLAGPAEAAAIKATINSVPAPATPAPDVLAAFVERLTADPGAAAIECSGRTISRATLAAAAVAVADQFAAAGVQRGQVVAIDMPRSGAAVAAMLGALAAGVVWVPLDHAWPAARRAAVIDGAAAVAVLVAADEPVADANDDANAGAGVDAAAGPQATGSTRADASTSEREAGAAARAASAPLRLTVPALAADSPSDPAAATDLAARLLRDAQPGDPAYILFTSGSTGRPKGVRVGRPQLAAYIAFAASAYEAEGLAWPLFTSLGVDLTLTSIFVPLVAGGRIVVYPARAGRGDLALLDVASDDAVDIIKATPSHLELLRNHDLRSGRVRQLVIGGEDLGVGLAGRTAARFAPGLRIFNEYGPTEATVGCIVHRFDAANDRGASVPIGRPVPGVRAHVVDEHGRPVPLGVPGELLLAGDQLADGYTTSGEGDAEAAAADANRRFAAAPHVGEDRAYRTGDRVRASADGWLTWLGRRDAQLKIRGTRIEAGEIEAVARAVPGVESCIAALRPATGTPGGAADADANAGAGTDDVTAAIEGTRADQLMLWWTGDAAAGPAIRAAASARLPEAAVPVQLLHVVEWPRGASGKVDVDRLPLPDPAHASNADPTAAPRTPSESILAGIWADVLGLAAVGIHDDWFGLGGDSITAIQVVARARAADPPVILEAVDVFDAPTIAGLAGLAASRGSAAPTGSSAAGPADSAPADSAPANSTPAESTPASSPSPRPTGLDALGGATLDKLAAAMRRKGAP